MARRTRWSLDQDDTSTPRAEPGEGMPIQVAEAPPETPVSLVGNRVLFYRSVSAESAIELVASLRSLSTELRKNALDLGTDPAPIHLHIHSEGGDLFAGLAMMDAILSCPVPVHTHVDGMAASAATLLSVAGAHRTIGPHGFLLVHQLRSGLWGKFDELSDHMKNSSLLMETVRDVYRKRTGLSGRKLDALLKRDVWLPASLALEYGLVDEIA